MANAARAFHVGGVEHPRPFKIRRLGHVAFDIDPVGSTLDFFVRDLGLYLSDSVDLRGVPAYADAIKDVDDPRVIFLATASDHHSLVLVPRAVGVARRGPSSTADVTNGQLSFQVSSIEEVIEAKAFLEAQGILVPRIGRDLPGSNWHTYFPGPEGLTVELYYGMEQIGWARTSKPKAMYDLATVGTPTLPIATEHSEIDDALGKSVDLMAGSRPSLCADGTDVVGGVALPRPFRVTRVGPAAFFMDDVDRALDFYVGFLGLTLTERAVYKGKSCAYLRAGTEHHSLALLPIDLREGLGIGANSRNYSVGLQVGSYDQLRRAGLFMIGRGWRQTEGLPAELHPGVDNAIYFEDPRGNRVMLFYYMEQIGWDGQPRPSGLRSTPLTGSVTEWPERIQAPADVYADFPLMGPLG